MLSRFAARASGSARAVSFPRSPVLVRGALPATWSRGMASGDDRSGASRFSRPANPQTKASVNQPSKPRSRTSQPAPSPASKLQSQPQPAPASKPETPAAAPAPPRQTTPPPASQPAQDAQPKRAQDAQSKPAAPSEPPKTKPEEAQAKPEAAQVEPEEPIDLSKLPDLTQGLPSTLEYETAGATDKGALAPIEEDAPDAGRGGRGKGELPASAYISSSDRRRQRLFNWLFVGSGVALVAGTVYLGREWDDEEQAKFADIPNGWALGSWWNRARARLGFVLTYYQEPAFEKLLPDPVPGVNPTPYTLCISLEDMLVHSEWTREHGWRIAKRPGMDYFIRYLSQYYEIVLFTSVPMTYADQLLRKLDPFHIMTYYLTREATKYKDGEIVKDLSYLNRDLSKVILIDTEKKHARAQPENAIILPKWTGDPKDTELVSLVPFLEYIVAMNYGDVRKVLQSFEGKHIPTEFARREAIARAEFNKQLEQHRGKTKKAPASGSGMGLLTGLLGMKPEKMSLMVMPDGEETPQEALAKGKMLQDIARERGKKQYEWLEKQIRENGDQWLKDMQEEQEKAQKEVMKNMQSSFTGWFGVKPNEEEQNEGAPAEKKQTSLP